MLGRVVSEGHRVCAACRRLGWTSRLYHSGRVSSLRRPCTLSVTTRSGSSSLDVKALSQWSCKFTTTTLYTVSDYTVWLIIAVTVERYVVVCHALTARAVCRRRKALVVITALLIIFVALNLHFFWTVELRSVQVYIAPPAECIYITSASTFQCINPCFSRPIGRQKRVLCSVLLSVCIAAF